MLDKLATREDGFIDDKNYASAASAANILASAILLKEMENVYVWRACYALLSCILAALL